MQKRPVVKRDLPLWDTLISATEHCLRQKSHLELTTREIAADAGTYAGMVNYYFNNKSGLLTTLIEKLVSEASRRLSEIEAAIEIAVDDPTEFLVRGFVESYHDYTMAMTIIIIEIYQKHSEIKDQYAKGGGTQSFDRLERMFRKLVDKGIYRKDLNTTTATWMLTSFVVGPHLLEPISKAMNAKLRTPDFDEWITEITIAMRGYLLPAR